MDTVEEWRGVPNYSGYEVSNLGRVRSWRHKNGLRKRPWIFKQYKGPLYWQVSLSNGNGLWSSKCVHSLVLTAFKGPRPFGLEACHNDGNGHNNNITNLRWDTRSNNIKDTIKHGTWKKITNHRHKIQYGDIPGIKGLFSQGLTKAEIGRRYGVSGQTIREVVEGRHFMDK